MTTIKKLLPDLIAIAAFALLSFAYFFPADIENRILFQHDTAAGVGLGQEVKEYYEATGERSRWTNSAFGGMPMYQIAPSYDSTRPLTWAQKVYQLFLPEYVCLVFMLMTGFYILLRAFGMPVGLSALGGLVWAFSSYFFILLSAGHIWKFITLAYVPPTIAGIVLAYRGRLLWGGILTALFVALQIVSNHVQMSYYFFFVILFLVGAYLYEAWKSKRLPQFFRACAVLFVATLIGVAMNLSNLYHTYTYSKETMRGKSELVQTGEAAKQASSGLDRDYITQWSYGIGETWTLLVPNFKGGASVPLSASETAMEKANPVYGGIYGSLTQYFGEQPMTSGPVYVGAFVLFLFILGCFIVKGPMKWALLGATILSVLLSWGRNFMPLTDLFIDYVPMYNKFRAVSSILVIAEFTIPLLALFALKRVLDEPALLKQNAKPVGISLALTAGMALLIYAAPGLFNSFIPSQEMAMLQNAVAQQAIPAEELGGILASLTGMRTALVTSDALRSLIIIGIGTALLWMYATSKLRAPLTVGGIILLCLVDMWGVNKRYLNDSQFVPRTIRQETFVQTPADKLILQDSDPDYRVLNLTTNTFNENNTSYWHKSIGGYHPAKLRRYQELIDRYIAPQMQQAYSAIVTAQGDMEQVDANSFPILNLLNTRYFILPAGEQGRQQLPVLNPHAYGNAWFVDRVQYVGHANEELDALGSVDTRETAVVDARFRDALQGATELQPDSLSTIRLTEYAPGRLTYETENAHDGVAVFSEIYYPDGWQVTIDGEPAALGRADYVLRTLYIPAGKHVVKMHFDPKSLHVTEGIAYGAFALLGIGIVFGIALTFKTKRKQK